MDHSDIVFYISSLLDSITLSTFKQSNRFIYHISNSVYQNRTSQEHVETLLTYDSFSYCYVFNNRIDVVPYKSVIYDGFTHMKSKSIYLATFKNKLLKFSILRDGLNIHSKTPLSEDVIHNLINQLNLPPLELKTKTIKMIRKYQPPETQNSIYRKYRKYPDDHLCCSLSFGTKQLSIKAGNYDILFAKCKKLF